MKFRFIAAVIACGFCLSALATDTTVTFPVTGDLIGTNLNGNSISDFTFQGEWRNLTGEAPAIYEYASPHSISYDLGTFTFKSMQLGGWPIPDANQFPLFLPSGGSFDLQFQFLNGLGNVIKTDSLILSRDNTLINFSDLVGDVHSIKFLPTGNGNFPRLESVTIAAVPEPATYLMLLSGFVLLAVSAHRNSSSGHIL